MTGRMVFVTDEAAAAIEDLGTQMLATNDPRASKLLAVALAWRYAKAEPGHSVKVDEAETRTLRLLNGGAA